MLDEKIIELYWDRSEQAITASDQKYGKYCSSIAWRILYDKEDTEECVNDTWLHAWNAIPPQRPKILKAFLGKITRNLSLNLYEKRHASRRGGGETPACLDELEECVGHEGRTDSYVERSVLNGALQHFLESLSEQDRKLFVQRYWYALSVKEISEEADMGESAVKMKLLRMREKLRTVLEREEVYV